LHNNVAKPWSFAVKIVQLATTFTRHSGSAFYSSYQTNQILYNVAMNSSFLIVHLVASTDTIKRYKTSGYITMCL